MDILYSQQELNPRLVISIGMKLSRISLQTFYFMIQVKKMTWSSFTLQDRLESALSKADQEQRVGLLFLPDLFIGIIPQYISLMSEKKQQLPLKNSTFCFSKSQESSSLRNIHTPTFPSPRHANYCQMNHQHQPSKQRSDSFMFSLAKQRRTATNDRKLNTVQEDSAVRSWKVKLVHHLPGQSEGMPPRIRGNATKQTCWTKAKIQSIYLGKYMKSLTRFTSVTMKP